MRRCDLFDISSLQQEYLDRAGVRDDRSLLGPDFEAAKSSAMCVTVLTNADLSLAWSRLDFLPNTSISGLLMTERRGPYRYLTRLSLAVDLDNHYLLWQLF